MPSNPTASPTVSSTVGLKNMVIAPLTVDTEETLTYGDLQLVAGAIETEDTFWLANNAHAEEDGIWYM